MPSFSVFCTETCIAGCRYRGIAEVSAPDDQVATVTSHFARVLAEAGVGEFSWSNLTNATYRFPALKILDCIVSAVADAHLRADVLIWDTDDPTHRIGDQDDATFQGMFLHLLKTTLKRRTPGSEWSIYPDENLGVHLQTLHDWLQGAARRPTGSPEALFAELIAAQRHVVRRVVPVSRHEHALAQAADLLCGLGVFSRHRYDAFAAWASLSTGHEALPSSVRGQPGPSASDVQRFEIMQAFKTKASMAKLGVSLTSTRGLRTRASSRPLNFWWYEPL